MALPSPFFSEPVSAGPRDSRARRVPRHLPLPLPLCQQPRAERKPALAAAAAGSGCPCWRLAKDPPAPAFHHDWHLPGREGHVHGPRGRFGCRAPRSLVALQFAETAPAHGRWWGQQAGVRAEATLGTTAQAVTDWAKPRSSPRREGAVSSSQASSPLPLAEPRSTCVACV